MMVYLLAATLLGGILLVDLRIFGTARSPSVLFTGLWLVLVSDDAVALHVASHIAFFCAVAAHLGLVLKHQLIDRDRLLRRML